MNNESAPSNLALENTADRFELHTNIDTPCTPLDALAQACEAQQYPLSRQQIKQAMKNGSVWVSSNAKTKPSRIRRHKKALVQGSQLHLYFDKQVQQQTPAPCLLILDNDHYSIWLKPSGVYSQGSKWGDHCTVTRWVEQQLTPQRPAFLVHRLDRATTGLILVAHSKQAVQKLTALFEQRSVEKKYQAWVHGEFPDEPMTVNTPIDGRNATSHFRRLKFNAEQFSPEKQRSLVDVSIETGRKHQIRQHLTELGFPIVGDRLHGIEQTEQTGENLKLCAYHLSFCCPFTNELQSITLSPEQISWISAVHAEN